MESPLARAHIDGPRFSTPKSTGASDAKGQMTKSCEAKRSTASGITRFSGDKPGGDGDPCAQMRRSGRRDQQAFDCFQLTEG